MSTTQQTQRDLDLLAFEANDQRIRDVISGQINKTRKLINAQFGAEAFGIEITPQLNGHLCGAAITCCESNYADLTGFIERQIVRPVLALAFAGKVPKGEVVRIDVDEDAWTVEDWPPVSISVHRRAWHACSGA